MTDMKKVFKPGLALMMTIMLSLGFSVGKAKAQNPASVNYQTFYDDLSPYGTWIDYPAYGHVWHPGITGDFRPYLTNGYWDYSADGWMWISNYDWGWAPFHYGRWVYDDQYGWLWIPGYEWSPAWVTWGMFDNFYAWAPLMPSVNINIAFDSWKPAAYYWNVCSRDHIYDRDITSRVERRDFVPGYINHIAVINNFGTTRLHNQYYAKGPELKEVEKFTNRKIEPATIHETGNAAIPHRQGNEIQVYKPEIANPQPREFRRIENNDVNPVRNDNDRVNTGRIQQEQNINRLPIHKAPDRIFGKKRGN